MTDASALDVLLRWERAGGTWEVLGSSADSVTVALCRCDGGEEVDRIESADTELAAYVRGRPSRR